MYFNQAFEEMFFFSKQGLSGKHEKSASNRKCYSRWNNHKSMSFLNAGIIFLGVFLESGDNSEQGSLASSSNGSDEKDGHCSANSVSSFIKKHIPTAQLVEHVGSELTYVLPTEAAKEGKFQDMFEDLDRNLGKLRVGSYGVSDTTLEEVHII